MPGIRFLDGVHRQRPDRVDGELFDLRVGQALPPPGVAYRERNGYRTVAAPARISSLSAASASPLWPAMAAASTAEPRTNRNTALPSAKSPSSAVASSPVGSPSFRNIGTATTEK